MTLATQSFRNTYGSRSDRWTSDPALIDLLALRNHEKPRVTSGFWCGVRFALLGIAPFYLLVIYMWLR
jgi:hypothetical protein